MSPNGTFPCGNVVSGIHVIRGALRLRSASFSGGFMGRFEKAIEYAKQKAVRAKNPPRLNTVILQRMHHIRIYYAARYGIG